jgi:hypothetical protein
VTEALLILVVGWLILGAVFGFAEGLANRDFGPHRQPLSIIGYAMRVNPLWWLMYALVSPLG